MKRAPRCSHNYIQTQDRFPATARERVAATIDTRDAVGDQADTGANSNRSRSNGQLANQASEAFGSVRATD
ncbi:MAG: hypothetical protein M3460_25310 [Actinomycetota bacterium]|nr:hypothetical protein [Actinomycetota bacterium]